MLSTWLHNLLYNKNLNCVLLLNFGPALTGSARPVPLALFLTTIAVRLIEVLFKVLAQRLVI